MVERPLTSESSPATWSDLVFGLVAGALASATIFLPVLVRQNVIPYDYEFYHFPLWRFIFDSIHLHQFPHYDPFSYSGMPFAEYTQSMLCYPPILMFFFVKDLLSSDLTIYDCEFINLFHYTVAYAGIFMWVRRRGAPAMLAHAISLSAVFGGAWLANTQHAGFVGALGWFPWLLLATDHLIEEPRPIRIMPVGAVLALIQLAGFFPIAITENLLWALYCLVTLLNRSLGRRDGFRSSLERLIALAAAQLLHALLTAVSWIGAVATLSGSAAVAAHGPLDWSVLLTMFAPNVFGHFNAGGYVGPGDITTTYLFAGVLPILAFCSFAQPLSAFRNVALIVGLIYLLMALDPFALSHVIQRLPVLGVLYRPQLFYYFVPFFLILSLVDVPPRLMKSGAWIAVVVLLATAAAIAFPAVVVRHQPMSWVQLCQGVAIGVAAIVAVTRRRALQAQSAMLLVLSLSVVGFHAFVGNHIWRFDSRPESYGPDTVDYDNRDLIAALRQSDEPYRVAVEQKSLGGPFNGGWQVWRIETINGFEPVLDKDYSEYVTNGLARWSTDRTFGDFDPASEKFNELNVLFLLVPSTVTVSDPAWELVFDHNVRVYRNTRFTPRFRLAEQCSPEDSVRLLATQPGRHVLRITTSCDQTMLVASERPHRGWSADIDGTSVEWRARNPAIGITIGIPRGTHVVTLRYRTPLFFSALAVEGLSLVMLLALLVTDRRAVYRLRRIFRARRRIPQPT